MKKVNVVELIHADFDEAEDFLLQEAEKFEETHTLSKEEQDHTRLMAELGFENAKVVQATSEKRDLLKKNQRLAELVNYYKQTYPLLKFLTVVQLEDICEKYNLIFAPVTNYIEDVPPKNLKEIANSQELRVNDMVEDDKRENRRGRMIEKETTGKTGLFIAGPKSHFNLEGLTSKGKKGFFKTIMEIEPDDPIVFRYVRGGIQVLSKWGLEAEDPMLTNGLDN